MRSVCIVALFVLVSASLSAQDIWTKYALPEWGPVRNIAVTPRGDIFVDVTDRGLFRSTNAGISWQKPLSSSSTDNYYQDFISDKSGLLYKTLGWVLWRSVDNGDSWTMIRDSCLLIGLAIDTQHRMYATSQKGIFWSDDSGRTMHRTSVTAGFGLSSNFILAPDGIIFARDQTKLYRSNDRGTTWDDLFPNLPDAFQIVALCSDPAGDLYGVITRLDTFHMFQGFTVRSTDHGDTWIDEHPNSPNEVSQIISPAIGEVIGLIPTATMGRTTDSGKTWNSFGAGMDMYNHHDMDMLPDGRLVVGGRGCIYITNKPVGVEKTPEAPQGYALAQSYPNPASAGQTVTIPFSITKEETISLRLYNMSGQPVAIIAEGRYGPGSYNANYVLSNLSPGVYACRLATSHSTQTRMMVVR